MNTSAASAVRPSLNMVVVRATGTGSILTRLIGWKNKPGMTDVPTKRIIGLAIARVSKARISIKLDNLVLGAKPQRRDTAELLPENGAKPGFSRRFAMRRA